MHRKTLLTLIDRYAAAAPPQEGGEVECFRAFVADRGDCFERTCAPGHVTGSVWILDAGRDRFLLTHHRKLSRWLQLGGHSDGDPDTLSVALREAREESGMQDFALVVPDGGRRPLDLDIHEIPARPREPAHLHYDVRFLLVAVEGQSLVCSDESNQLQWFARDALAGVETDDSVRRLAHKAAGWLAAPHHLESLPAL